MSLAAILKSLVFLAVAMGVNAQAPLPNAYEVVNLVSNVSGGAAVTDPNLVNPWGISASAASPFWVSDHNSGLTTLYNGAGAITPTVVTIPSASGNSTGTPSGSVQNSAGAAFTLANGGNASFIFSTEDGLIVAWNTGAVAQVMVNNSGASAVYKGLATGTSAAGGTLYGANFRSGRVDTWGPGFAPVSLAGAFTDPAVPAGFAPFNIANLGGSLFVEYAKQDASQFFDVGGAGNGYVAVFDQNGNLLRHLVSGGPLNSPWGVAIAPANWGAFGGALLVGNFGDGRVNAFNVTTGAPLGALQNLAGSPVAITGLWSLLFGGSETRSDVNTLYFTAGMPDGSTTPRGLLGSIAPPSAITAIVNAASWLPGPVSPGELIVIGGQTVGAIPFLSATIPATGAMGTALAGTTVSINNILVPIIYTDGSETSVQVPNVLLYSSSASIVVQTPGQASQALVVPMSQSTPGLFAANAAGTGQLAALNSDGSVNSPANAAARGTAITLFATGEGATNPPSLDGTIQSFAAGVPILPVALLIGGLPASVSFAGTPLGILSGLMVINAVVPTEATPGPVSVVLSLGRDTFTQNSTTQNVTLSVK